MSADVAGVGAAKGEEAALGVERQLGVRYEIAALIIGQEGLPPFARPLHGAAETPRRPGDQHELRVAAIAGAEVSADLARHHAHRALRDAEGAGHAGPRPPQAAGAGMNGVAATRRVPRGDRRARLHRHAGDALHPRVQAHHVSGLREGEVHRRGLADLGVHAHVRRGALIEDRRVGSGGVDGGRRRGQRRPVDADPLRPVARRRGRLGEDHGHHLAREARAIGRDRRMRGDERHVALPDHLLVGIARHGAVRDRLHAVGHGVLAGEDGDHPRRGQRRRGVDAPDPRVGVRRADEARVGLAGKIDVVTVAPRAHEEARVLLAQDRLAESVAGRAASRLEEGHVAADRERERDQTVAGWNSRVLPSGSLHSIWMRPPGCVFSTYLIPSRSSVAFIAS